MVITLKINPCYIDDGWDHKLESAVWFWFSAWLDFRSLDRLVWHPSGCVRVFSERMNWCGKTYPAGGGNTPWAQGLDAVRAGAGGTTARCLETSATCFHCHSDLPECMVGKKHGGRILKLWGTENIPPDKWFMSGRWQKCKQHSMKIPKCDSFAWSLKIMWYNLMARNSDLEFPRFWLYNLESWILKNSHLVSFAVKHGGLILTATLQNLSFRGSRHRTNCT